MQVDIPNAPLLDDDAPPSHPHSQHQLQFSAQCQPTPHAHPREDNTEGFASNISGLSTCPELKAEANMRHFDSKPDDMELKLDHMDSRFDRMESFFTTELSTINELLTVLVVICRSVSHDPQSTPRDTNDDKDYEE
ncbi:hypothetical protein E6C27_scaffold36G001470 [Cucumis melo var. makuwa]|uniref:Uncharacterized protein n=1 Tax=Cucumis melo var. makuwa TaxID=1194695 RepID=A0A5A7T917_CUCMM|nr:hypothetical protein E6C27_scaffold36G001470 [Cucumis melo var. makuwa]